MKVCFLILHYNEIKLTEKAVNSIVEMDGDSSDKVIVIVDNASPNGSGLELERIYGDSADYNDIDIHVIRNSENGGFSKGNNVGYRYIKENYDADFVIALNNDISFPQKDFISLLTKVYDMDTERFYLAGPDVYTPNIRSHISPLDIRCKDIGDVKKRFDQIEESVRILEKSFDPATFTRYLQDKYQGSKLLEIYNNIRKSEYDGAAPHNLVAYDCVLNGACLIFDKRYIRENEFLFEEKTFLYAEEDFLTHRLINAGKRIRYCPELIVNHVGQGSSGFGGMNYRQYCQKSIATQKVIREAFEKYLEYIR